MAVRAAAEVPPCHWWGRGGARPRRAMAPVMGAARGAEVPCAAHGGACVPEGRLAEAVRGRGMHPA